MLEAAHGFRSFANGLAAIGAPTVVAQRAAATVQPGLAWSKPSCASCLGVRRPWSAGSGPVDVLINLTVDVLYAYIDPRIGYG